MATRDPIHCPSCHHDNRPDRRFCTECGATLAVACPSCGAPTEPGEKFCGGCGGSRTRKPRALLSWSSGKDSAWALQQLRAEGTYDIVGLVTTVNEAAGRVAMHAVRESLLAAQAAAVDLPLWRVPIPSPCNNEQYEMAMNSLVERARVAGVSAFAFGDLYLADIRAYRERQLAGSGLTPLFPLWMRPTRGLADEMLAAGLGTVLTCVDPKQLAPRFAGRTFDTALLRELPPSVDPCGENGEFLTFAYAGPMFRHRLAVTVGEVVERDGFVFTDVTLS